MNIRGGMMKKYKHIRVKGVQLEPIKGSTKIAVYREAIEYAVSNNADVAFYFNGVEYAIYVEDLLDCIKEE